MSGSEIVEFQDMGLGFRIVRASSAFVRVADMLDRPSLPKVGQIMVRNLFFEKEPTRRFVCIPL